MYFSLSWAKNTSTPKNLRFYSLCKRKITYEESTLQQDFKIDEDFDEYEFLSDCSSGCNSGSLSGIQIHEDFSQFCEESENEDESMHVWEIVTVIDSDYKLNFENWCCQL